MYKYNPIINDRTILSLGINYDDVHKHVRYELPLNFYNKYQKEIMRLTNNSYDDLFVRFLGMSKLNVSGTKTICTVDRDLSKFGEYIEKGYRIDLVNPIEVKDGIIQERNLNDFDTIRKVLK